MWQVYLLLAVVLLYILFLWKMVRDMRKDYIRQNSIRFEIKNSTWTFQQVRRIY